MLSSSSARLCLLALFLQLASVWANTEKVIFIAPSPFQVPTAPPTIDELHLETLTPQHSSVRTHLQAQFPTDSAKHGVATWVLLDQLKEGQRYEARVCWAATQPTSFRLDVYELETVFASPEQVTSLALYSAGRQPDLTSIEDQEPQITQELQKPIAAEVTKSMLFLHILAAADYYTMNKTLMANVPPVYVDIILDPFLLNVFPRSLVPTAIYIIVLAIGSWFLSRFISAWFLAVARDNKNLEKKKS